MISRYFSPNSASVALTTAVRSSSCLVNRFSTAEVNKKQPPLVEVEPNTQEVHFKHSNPDQHPLKDISKNEPQSRDPFWKNPIPHPVYTEEDLNNVVATHREADKMHAKVAYYGIRAMRTGFDIVTRYKGPGGEMTKRDWLNRCLFLETVAGVPGMVAGMLRHLKSLRTLERDHGWIHTLLEEAENERMHLLIFMSMKNPNILFRLMVLGGQGVFFNVFFLAYIISPTTCHRFVGYLEEEAVHTYTSLLKDMDEHHLDDWAQERAPLIAANYYNLDKNSATVNDVIKCIRADEANHRDTNHTFADLDWNTDTNPFINKHKK